MATHRQKNESRTNPGHGWTPSCIGNRRSAASSLEGEIQILVCHVKAFFPSGSSFFLCPLALHLQPGIMDYFQRFCLQLHLNTVTIQFVPWHFPETQVRPPAGSSVRKACLTWIWNRIIRGALVFGAAEPSELSQEDETWPVLVHKSLGQ